ncbi:hypothetical protein CYMTET_41825 [Cymbomonas tetramitiformis]|uniref:C2H2-type domain-containing protein n=1 Tax=Cymbomonas tetramitiformis TaxID=36881 RepID=A0AAE0C6N7_9CHLO|nr:hypothetical protein CYMTET_41825 [Cymbomonas tetramitiformis]
MGFKKKKKVAKEGNTHAQKEPSSGTAESGKPRQNIQRLLKQLEDLTNENTKLRSEIAAKESSITALKKSLKDAKADAREAWNNLSECETKLERKADNCRHMKSRLHARAQVEEPDRVFSSAPATSTSEKAEATRKRNARMAEQVEALLQAEPVLLQSMLEDSPSSEHSTQLPVYIEILVAFLSRHRLAIPAALGILSNQKNTKLLLYLDKHANNNDVLCEIEHYFTQRAVNEIITNWTPTIGLAIRFRLGISEQNYDMLRQMLSKSFDRDSTTATTWYVLHKQSCDGTVKWQIKAPKLPSNYAVSDKDDLLDTSKTFELRTYQKILELVHRAEPPFTCSDCGKHFRNQAAVDNDKLASTKSGRKEQVRQHFGHYLHCVPVFPVWECEGTIDVISACVACLLHWLLRLIDMAFMFTVHIHVDTEEKAATMSTLLQEKGVSLSKNVKPFDAMRASNSRDDKTTLTGEHSATVLADYADFLALHTPESRKDTYEDTWLSIYCFFELMWRPVEDTPEHRVAHAEEVYAKATEMVDAISDGLPAVNSLYLHISLHLPEIISRHGCNLRQYSGQGGGHLNKMGQVFTHAFTNKRMRVYRDKKSGGIKKQRVGMIGQNLRAEHVAHHVREHVLILTKWPKSVMKKTAKDAQEDEQEA